MLRRCLAQAYNSHDITIYFKDFAQLRTKTLDFSFDLIFVQQTKYLINFLPQLTYLLKKTPSENVVHQIRSWISGLAEAKALAQQSVEKAQLQSAEQLELRIRELKVPGGDLGTKNLPCETSWVLENGWVGGGGGVFLGVCNEKHTWKWWLSATTRDPFMWINSIKIEWADWHPCWVDFWGLEVWSKKLDATKQALIRNTWSTFGMNWAAALPRRGGDSAIFVRSMGSWFLCWRKLSTLIVLWCTLYVYIYVYIYIYIAVYDNRILYLYTFRVFFWGRVLQTSLFVKSSRVMNHPWSQTCHSS